MNLVMVAGMCKWVEWGLGGDELEAHWAKSSNNPSHGRGYPRLRSSTANRRPGCHLPWGDSGKAWKIPDAKKKPKVEPVLSVEAKKAIKQKKSLSKQLKGLSLGGA